jgi:PAS domain S-box-containing protein
MTIDIRTAAIFSTIVYLFLFVVTLVYASVVKQYRGVRYWALWNLVFAVGTALWLLSGVVPPWVSIIFGNALQVFAGCFLYFGASLFIRNRRGSLLIFALPSLTLLLLFYFTLYNDNIVIRTEILSLMGCAIGWATGYVILRSPSRPLPTSYKFTGIIFVAYGLTFLIRALLAPLFAASPSPFAPTFAQVFFYLLAPIFGLLITVGFGLMIIQRLLAELQHTANALEQEHSRTKTMLENLAAGVVACNNEGQLTTINQVAREFHEWPSTIKSLEQISESHPIYLPDGQTAMKKEERPLYRALQGEQVRDVECILKSRQGEAHHFLVNASPLLNAVGQRWGGVAVFTNITERKQAMEAQAALLAELQQALKEIKTLRGLIPICAHCKNVRDDRGFWQQVEDYFQQHTEAEFSHGICPDCFEKHFGNLTKSRSLL